VNRYGRDSHIPHPIFGPKVMLINEYARSGGHALAWVFKRLGIGLLIGTRTWGGMTGFGSIPTLMDGGTVTVPSLAIENPDTGELDVENKGVPPDIEVEFDPAVWRQGRDPQLEKAVSVALDNLREHPVPKIRRPGFPIYHWPAFSTATGTPGKLVGQK
jgi:tricorn protease